MNYLELLLNDPQRVLAWIWSKVGHIFSEAVYLKVRFYLLTGKKLNLNNPTTFSEKIQWLKLYNRKPEYTKMVDKYAVKDYVASIIGEEYIIPTLGVWDKPEEIEWDKLPDQFVLKTTHGGGSLGVVICRNKSTFDRKKAIAILKANMYTDWRIQIEWPYKNVPRRIIAEKYIEPDPLTKDLPDYKFFCFNGEPRYCQVISGRNETMCIDFFDHNWNHQPFHEPKNYPFAAIEPQRPSCLEQMWDMARKLAQGEPFLRVDFYQVCNQILFGEITFYPTSGIGGFDPESFDYTFGELIDLNKN